MTSMSIRELPALLRRLGATPYLWVRLGSREWLIRDEALLRQAAAIWPPIEAMKPEQRELGAEEARLDKRIDAIEDGNAKAEPVVKPRAGTSFNSGGKLTCIRHISASWSAGTTRRH